MQKIWPSLVWAFYILAALLVLKSKAPETREPHPVVMRSLLEGSEGAIIGFGKEYEIFRKNLPSSGTVSFLMDHPFHPYSKTVDQLYTAQSYLVPILLNHEPGEKLAIFYCSDIPTALRRIQETGYSPTLPLAEGKAIGTKT